MAIIEIKNFCFSYATDARPVLSDINLKVEKGEFVILCGASASGKTTLLRNLKPEIAPAGKKSGRMLYKGRLLDDIESHVCAKDIGMVFQEPDAQMVMDTVRHELAFSLENFGVAPSKIKKRIAEMALFFGIEDLLHKPVSQLSGGEKQLINVCSVLVLKPSVLLLDEPTSQLDPIMTQEFIKLLQQINTELSITILMSEHRLQGVFSLAHRVVFLEQGRIIYQGPPEGMAFAGGREPKAYAKFLPPELQLLTAMTEATHGEGLLRLPLTLRESKDAFEALIHQKHVLVGEQSVFKRSQEVTDQWNLCTSNPGTPKARPSKALPMLHCDEISFRYDPHSPIILSHVTLQLYPGEILAILGGNGTGKTTLLQIMAGLLYPQDGDVSFKGKKIKRKTAGFLQNSIGYVAQNPVIHFTEETVQEELKSAGAAVGKLYDAQKFEAMLAAFEFSHIASKHPYDISLGQQQKLAIASALMRQPEILLMDEPTKGMDPLSKEQFAGFLMEQKEKGMTVVLATHDLEFAAGYATRCAMLSGGEVMAVELPYKFFSDNYFYTTAVHRMVRDYFPDALTVEDVLKACNFKK